MPQATPIPHWDPREVIRLVDGAPLPAATADYEFTWGGVYLLNAKSKVGGAWGTANVQLQVYVGPEEQTALAQMDPSYWQNAGSALTADTAAAVRMEIGAQSKVRMVLASGAAAGTGLYITLKRVPQA